MSYYELKLKIEKLKLGKIFMKNEYKLLRIFLSENEKINGKLAYKYIVEFLLENKIAGATVLRGILGYGSSFQIHSASILTLSEDLPIVIEVVDRVDKLEKVIPKLKEFLNGKGMITIEKIEVIYPEL